MYKLLIKFFLIVILVLSCIAIGISISSYFKKRKKFFAEYLFFLDFCSNYIKNSNEKISLIIDRYSKTQNEFSSILIRYKYLIENKTSKENFLESIKSICYFLKEEEISMLFDTFMDLGSFDEYSELNRIEISKKIIQGKVLKTTNESGKLSPFFIKMSVLFGMFLFIVFI